MELPAAIQAGLVEEASFQVKAQNTASEMGSGPRLSQDGSLEILATPGLIAFMEHLAHGMLEKHLPEGVISLGTQVQVNHLAPTPLGGTLRVRAEISRVEGRRVTFSIQAWDEHTLVGEGVHQRVIVQRESFLGRLKTVLDR